MHRNPSVSTHKFAMAPSSRIPRSKFKMQKTLKSTFDAGYLNPILVLEVLPGDTFNCKMTAFVRLATPLYPIMDNLHLETFFFFVPNRLTWTNWKKFMGEQDSPGDSISFTIPKKTSPAGGFAINTIYDLMGLPCAGQIGAGNTISVNALPLRAYNLIYNNWFRDENLINWVTTSLADGPDTTSDFALRKRGKRHDYFTSCLPWPQKGSTTATFPITGQAPLVGIGILAAGPAPTVGPVNVVETEGVQSYGEYWSSSVANTIRVEAIGNDPVMYADLGLGSGASATINALRQANMIQEFLERDARGGTRYTEIVRRHFDVISPDARLQRPEYLGGGHASIEINPIAQTTATGLTGGTTPQGNLAAMGQTVANNHGFSQSFTEHGYIIGLASVRADLTYQQGLARHWTRSTRYDFYDPAFANLGEQAVLSKEIYCDGSANDDLVFGYQGRWDEYRILPSEIVGLFNSKHAGTLDPWHLAQSFSARPTLGQTFIEEDPPVQRILAVAGQTSKMFLGDFFFDITAARQMPMYNVPGITSLKL